MSDRIGSFPGMPYEPDLPGHRGLNKEKDPHGTAAKEPGAKLDAGKAPIFQGVLDYFPRAVMAVAELSAYGSHKYSWKGWEKVPDGVKRYADAGGRHITREAIEGPWDLDARNDPEFPADILHKTQKAWNALAELELYLRELELRTGKRGFAHAQIERDTAQERINAQHHKPGDRQAVQVREQMDPVDYPSKPEFIG